MLTFEDEIETRQGDTELVRTLVHEDGSRTYIYPGDYDDQQFSNPRDNDGNVLRMVQEHRDYLDLDEADEELAQVRGLADLLENYAGTDYDHMFPEDEDEFAARMHAEGKVGAEVVQAYLDEFRPDIVHYIHEWTVTGCSQSDWQHGWAYMTRADFESEIGPLEESSTTPAEVAEAELKIYQRWFEGDVVRAVHIFVTKPEFVIGDEGGYYTGQHWYDEEHCGGFLGYDDLKDIGWQFTSSPVIEEVW